MGHRIDVAADVVKRKAWIGVERKAWEGPWGLLRFLDGLRLRARDGGQRYLLDVRREETRAYLELAFARAANPAAARGLIAGLACPPAL